METARRPEASFGDVLDGVIADVVDHRQDKWYGVFMPALRTFHSLFGHSEVPEDFEVPHSTPTWPRPTWGLRLGQIISRSHDTKRLYKDQVAASQLELQKLGFTWKVTKAADRSWRHQVLPALGVFHQEHGHCNVESNFVVPEWGPWPKDAWGLNLGAIVRRIRAGRSYVDQATQDSGVLEKLGFLWDPRDLEWQECVLPALVTFADEFGDEVPLTSDFVVPCEPPWPKQTWGLELGLFLSDAQRREQYFVQIIRDVHVLDELGFELSLSDATWERQVVPLLTIFSTIFPNQLTLPADFVIPHKQPWPRKVWGLKLGEIGAQNASRMAEVEKDWKERRDSPETVSLVSENRSQQWKIRILPALVTFMDVFGDCRLGGHFTVPSEDPWPKPTWGLRLGAAIADYHKNGTYFEQLGRDADRLALLGFSFKLAAAPWEQYAAPLLETYSTIYPCTLVPENFVIPSQSHWPETMWGVKLGAIVRWNTHLMTSIENEWKTQVLTAVEVYRMEFGDVSIGQKFVIPSQPKWPKKTWGMDLARILHRLHIGECYDGHVALARNSIARLKHLLHRRRDEAWESIFTALKAFTLNFGHCTVKPHFVVPTRPSWPKAVWNLQLGQIVEKMKATGNFFSYAGRSANRLNELNFTLTLSNSAWEKKVAPLIATFATLHPRDNIPRGGFTVPSEEPWPENAWGVNLGLVVQWNLNRLETIERDWKSQVLQANEVFQYENGNKVMRDKFVVPCRSPWPYRTWGRELRHVLTCVQIGQHYGGHVALANFHANEACVVATPQIEKQWTTVVLPALHTFASVFGHCAVQQDFVVPALFPWPKPAFGARLGSIVAAMEKCGVYFAEVGLNADRLETFGFRYKLRDAPWQQRIAPLLSTFASLYPHEIVPEDFVIPPKAPWTQEFWGLRLGKIIAWSSRFVWTHKCSAEWTEREMPQNTSLAGEYGYCRVPSSFKVPSEHPWPKQMWGLRVKTYLRQMHQRGDLFIPGGLHRAMMSERTFGFVFKLAKAAEVSCGEPQREEFRADVEQIGIAAEQEEPESLLGKRQLPDASRAGWVGSYSPKSRKARVERFLKKRQERERGQVRCA
ncbi:hypothetical protein PF005_g5998 [Phytophthora fragariae]|uniref:Helicase-associated domain-containing protein n=3 Tax=Phytophthora fragariae TaxID=53985 RepID=A0A6A3YTP9_9STRA|nr:hypothetical protein PF003_g33541 [Phytophthora fragariae]KAE8943614.1 hypothetical protein PF009_g6676 [Phytophthora fragariae]KAE9021268.1 hypothetical protein PF011_g5028 [Phytophthora fragariae]KAE9125800.1 hypothetical protein PF007_g6227 [Phytophthora fragariae]KAE9126516.1 hypothetical protein PF010_g5246 [Phytophthora fragariae]